jgi:hypothetical protein
MYPSFIRLIDGFFLWAERFCRSLAREGIVP